MADLSVRVRLVEGSTSLATARSHGVVIDRPKEKGGADLSFLSGELLLASEGDCLLSNLIAAAQARGIALHRVDVTVRGGAGRAAAALRRGAGRGGNGGRRWSRGTGQAPDRR